MTGIFLAAFSFAAALMGAGFASGQETLSFFAVLGHYGVFAIIIASVIIALFCGIVSEYAQRADCEYSVILSDVFPCGVRRAVDIMTFIFAVCVEGVMYACFGELLKTAVGLPVYAGALGAALICGGAMLCGKENALKLNAVVGAFIFLFAAAVCLYLIGYREHQTFGAVKAAVSGGSYAGYNLLGAGAVTASGRVFLKKRGDGFLCGIAAGCMIFILLSLMWAVLGIYYGKINLGELPMITLAMRESSLLAAFYGVIIAAAVLTTAFSDGVCAAQYMEHRLGYKKSVVFSSAAGLALSGAGFSRLIDTVYRYCGMFGIFIAVWVIIKLMITMKKRVKRRF